MNEFQPIRMIEVELGSKLRDLPAVDAATGRRYSRANALVRLHAQPLGSVDLELGEDGMRASSLAQRIWDALGNEIVAHLRADGLSAVNGLSPDGLIPQGAPACVRLREDIRQNGPMISVVISTRNRAAVLERCLRSVLALDYPRHEVLVIDNAPSDDATAQLVTRQYGHIPHLCYVLEPRPGLSNARNRGVAEARGEIIAFTDDDVVVDKHWLTGLAQGFRRGADVGCVTGLVLPMELETQAQQWFEEFGGFGKGCKARTYNARSHHPNDRLFPYAAGRFGSGNNMAFRADVLRAIGHFDTALGAGSPTFGGEDLAAFVSVIREGHTLAYEPGAIVHHQHRRDYAGLRKHVYDCGVGLTAFLAKSLIDDPLHAIDFLAKVPFGLRYALDTASAKNRKKRSDYPVELTKIERRGMLIGPSAYLWARCRGGRSKARTVETSGLAANAVILHDKLTNTLL